MTSWRMASGAPVPRAAAYGLMGILNVTPDSFYNHSEPPLQACEWAEKLAEEGADIVDLGAESTRPGAKAITWQEECRRLLPALKLIRERLPEIVLSVDTRNAETAVKAMEAGCEIINDVSACRHDSAMLEVLAAFKPGYILMHAQGTPETMQKAPYYKNVVEEVKEFFCERLNTLVRAGLPEDHIVLDMGTGFGKTVAHNLELLRHAGEFLQFGRPLLAGISMKGTLGKICNLALNERGEATAVASALLFAKGVTWHRVHEVGRTRLALRLASALQA